MIIQDWPETERPREKLLARGAAALSDAELLAILFRTGATGCNAVDLARILLRQYEGLRQVCRLSAPEFCELKGLGMAKYVLIQACVELGRRLLHQEISQPRHVLSSPQDTKNFLRANLGNRDQEIFAGLFLDNRCHVIQYVELFHGTIDQATIYPREILKKALTLNAAGLIIAHNHPSGNPGPSEEDKTLTAQLASLLASVDMRLLDHFILTSTQAFSFSEHGLL